MSLLSLVLGVGIGLVSGYYRRVDAVIMRVMDGLMAIPAILLALALMAVLRASVGNVVIALVTPEIPRVVRLVRASVLSLREQTMLEGARAMGARGRALYREGFTLQAMVHGYVRLYRQLAGLPDEAPAPVAMRVEGERAADSFVVPGVRS